MSILGRLADALPEAHLFRQSFHHSIPTALPFSHRGFDLGLGYTYFIPELGHEDEIWPRISTSRRQDIQKAQKKLTVHPSQDLDLFLRLHRLTFERQGVPNPYSDDYVDRIHRAAVANDAGCLLIAFDQSGNAHGGHFLVYDEDATNGLMSGLDPSYRDSNAGSLLMWEALRFAAKQSRSFNFSGGTIRGVEPFISSFGGEQVPYVKVTRDSLRWRSILLAKDSARQLTSLPARLKAGS